MYFITYIKKLYNKTYKKKRFNEKVKSSHFLYKGKKRILLSMNLNAQASIAKSAYIIKSNIYAFFPLFKTWFSLKAKTNMA